MSDEKLSEREKLLIAEARAALISADILEEGFFGDLFAGFADLLGGGDLVSMLTGGGKDGEGGKADYNLKVGDMDAIRAFADKATFMPRKSKEIAETAEKGAKIVKDALEKMTVAKDKGIREFFKMAIESAAREIAKTQEEEVKKITSALSKQDLPDNVVKAYAGIIVPGSLLGALKMSLEG